jgi:hypothetical protein
MPSDKHIELSHKALVWLEDKATARGSRSCVELQLGEGYVADAGAICGLQYKWCRRFYLEPKEGDSDDYSFIFETKVSKSDFDNTFKRKTHKGDRLQPRANFHFVVTTKGEVLKDNQNQ